MVNDGDHSVDAAMLAVLPDCKTNPHYKMSKDQR